MSKFYLPILPRIFLPKNCQYAYIVKLNLPVTLLSKIDYALHHWGTDFDYPISIVLRILSKDYFVNWSPEESSADCCRTSLYEIILYCQSRLIWGLNKLYWFQTRIRIFKILVIFKLTLASHNINNATTI